MYYQNIYIFQLKRFIITITNYICKMYILADIKNCRKNQDLCGKKDDLWKFINKIFLYSDLKTRTILRTEICIISIRFNLNKMP